MSHFDELARLEGYVERSPLLQEGVRCSTCVFFQATRCGFIEAEVERDGACRYWLPEPSQVFRRHLPVEVHACVRAWAEAGSTVPLRILGTSLTPSPVERLLRRPAPGLSSAALWGSVVADLGYHGEAFVVKVRAPDGDVVQLGTLSPQLVLEVSWVEGEPNYRTASGVYNRRDLIHVALPVRESGRGLSPYAQVLRLGTEPSLEQIYRLYRVPLSGELTAEATKPWLRLIEEALANDEDLFPAHGGLTPAFQFTEAYEPPQMPVDRTNDLVEAMLELTRREPTRIEVQAPVVTLEPQIHLHQGQRVEKQVERDAEGRIARVIEQTHQTVDVTED